MNSESTGIAAHIRSLRLEARRAEADLATALGISLESYRDLELHDDEIETAISIAQAMQLARLLGTDLLGLLNETERPAPISIDALRAGLLAHIQRHPIARDALEEEINWDLSPFIEGLEDWTELYALEFVKRMATELSLDWRGVAAALVRAH